jgi:hypothetical protein
MKVIHTLQDLCYAYNVADPVREMLFALQDRIDALEAQRQPLTGGEIYTAYITAANQTLRPQDERIAFAFARAIEAAHGIEEQP